MPRGKDLVVGAHEVFRAPQRERPYDFNALFRHVLPQPRQRIVGQGGEAEVNPLETGHKGQLLFKPFETGRGVVQLEPGQIKPSRSLVIPRRIIPRLGSRGRGGKLRERGCFRPGRRLALRFAFRLNGGRGLRLGFGLGRGRELRFGFRRGRRHELRFGFGRGCGLRFGFGRWRG